jgi:hypothetical protein
LMTYHQLIADHSLCCFLFLETTPIDSEKTTLIFPTNSKTGELKSFGKHKGIGISMIDDT